MNAKISVFVICVKAMTYLLLYDLQDCIFKLKQNFHKKEVVTDKTPFFVVDPFCSHHSICLNIDF